MASYLTTLLHDATLWKRRNGVTMSYQQATRHLYALLENPHVTDPERDAIRIAIALLEDAGEQQ